MTIFKRRIDHIADIPKFAIKNYVGASIYVPWEKVVFRREIPENVEVEEIKKCLCEIDGVIDIHHIHIRSVDGVSISASLHVITDEESCVIKEKIREVLYEKEIGHITIEIETSSEHCEEKDCQLIYNSCSGHHHR